TAQGVRAEVRGGFEHGLAAGQGGVLQIEGGVQGGLGGGRPQREKVARGLVGEVEVASAGGECGLGRVGGPAGSVGGDSNGLVDDSASGVGGGGVSVWHYGLLTVGKVCC